jgi:hypothetical protein
MARPPTLYGPLLTVDCLRTLCVMVFAYVQLELAMRNFIKALTSVDGVPELERYVAKYRLRRPKRTLRNLVLARFADEPSKLYKFRRWHARQHKFHVSRNTVTYGSWIDETGNPSFFRYPRGLARQAATVHGKLSSEELARHMRMLERDVDTIEAWIEAYEPRPFAFPPPNLRASIVPAASSPILNGALASTVR